MTDQTCDARLSIYSGAPSIHPSLAPTFESHRTFNRSSHRYSMASARQTGPPSYAETFPLAAPEKQDGRRGYGVTGAAMTSTISLSASTDPRVADIKNWTGALERMQDARLDKQRYVMSGHKSEEVSMLALDAKVERALARRMVGQDASFRQKGSQRHMDDEKRNYEVQAN